MFKDYIQRLIKELAIPGGETLPHEMTSFHLMIDGIDVLLIDKAPGIDYFATVAYLPEVGLEPVLTDILRGNFLGQATRKAYLGLDESGQKVTAAMSIPQIRNFAEFRDMLEDFANVTRFWRAEIEKKTEKTAK